MKDAKSCKTIEEVRQEIDRIDREVMELLARRQDYVCEIIRFKKDEESIVAQGRQDQLYQQRREWAEELRLSPEMIEEVYKTMVRHNIQKELELHKQTKNS
ncbi:chorismate mutase [Mangrovibacterium diazotrophicum]|uniref:chorismate mutase n=1 Tax=Mangrovibacterium diazotrophicum TaxID=1261403 RepID=A0A419W542_9BACT|nr:chorismate mutase [Mangrovibacterium diazotrophicum]RKD90540.1 isochorismate pyruvate lyase [Mangrovibacterium diazotrophicum]